MESTSVIARIRQNAKDNVLNFETINILITTLFALFLWYISYDEAGWHMLALVLSVICTVVAVYGLSTRIPQVVYWINPYAHPLFRGKKDRAEKERYAQEIEREEEERLLHDFPNLLVTENYFVFRGSRSFDVIPIANTIRVYQQIFATRSKHGVNMLIFVDRDKHKHELTLRGGKDQDPLGEMARFSEALPGFAAHIVYGDRREDRKKSGH